MSTMKLLRCYLSLKFALVSIVVFQLIALTGSAQQTANLVVSPSNISSAIGQTFTVKVKVNILSGALNTAEAHLLFDKSVLQVTAIKSSAGNPLSLELVKSESVESVNKEGHLHYSAGAAGVNASSSFDLLEITFKVISQPAGGSTPLTLTTASPHTSQLYKNGVSVLNSLSNGVVNITAQ